MSEHIANRIAGFFAWLRWGRVPAGWAEMSPEGRVTFARKRYHFGRGERD